MIELDPEIAEIYQRSRAVSTLNGNSHNLMKAGSKRRRTRKEIKEEKLKEEVKKAEIEVKLREHAAYEQRVAQLQAQVDNTVNLDRAMDRLIENGLVKRGTTHDYQVVETFEEHQALKQQRLDDITTANQMQQQMQNQPSFTPSEERARAGNQLEMDHNLANSMQQPQFSQQHTISFQMEEQIQPRAATNTTQNLDNGGSSLVDNEDQVPNQAPDNESEMD